MKKNRRIKIGNKKFKEKNNNLSTEFTHLDGCNCFSLVSPTK